MEPGVLGIAIISYSTTQIWSLASWTPWYQLLCHYQLSVISYHLLSDINYTPGSVFVKLAIAGDLTAPSGTLYNTAMKRDLLANLVEEGSKLASDIVRFAMTPRPARKETVAATEAPPSPAPSVEPRPKPLPSLATDDLSYRFECVVKHLGGASVLLREAYERANDEGMGEGTKEKVVEAMNEHAGAEPDLEKMLGIPEGKPIADRLLSGVRAFRKAAWESKLPLAQGTKQDIADARQWNTIMLQDALNAAKTYPGTECVQEGM